jgi:bidirectional [NiFe] hydrogenase diaphorase subunit
MPTVTIDGRPCEAAVGETILEVARRNGIWIPTLCYHEAVEPYASCRLCLVEIDRSGWWQVVTSCNYPVRRDLAVRVEAERPRRARQGVMQLLLARSPESVELRALAARMGVGGTPYPTVTQSQRSCVLCGLCVRVCADRIGASAISLAGRGVDRAVAPPFREASRDCIGCGACEAVCPVGTIVVRRHEDTGEVEISPFKARVKLVRCASCGADVGSSLAREALKRKGGPTVVAALEHARDEAYARGDLCPACRRKAVAAELAKEAAR